MISKLQCHYFSLAFIVVGGSLCFVYSHMCKQLCVAHARFSGPFSQGCFFLLCWPPYSIWGAYRSSRRGETYNDTWRRLFSFSSFPSCPSGGVSSSPLCCGSVDERPRNLLSLSPGVVYASRRSDWFARYHSFSFFLSFLLSLSLRRRNGPEKRACVLIRQQPPKEKINKYKRKKREEIEEKKKKIYSAARGELFIGSSWRPSSVRPLLLLHKTAQTFFRIESVQINKQSDASLILTFNSMRDLRSLNLMFTCCSTSPPINRRWLELVWQSNQLVSCVHVVVLGQAVNNILAYWLLDPSVCVCALFPPFGIS